MDNRRQEDDEHRHPAAEFELFVPKDDRTRTGSQDHCCHQLDRTKESQYAQSCRKPAAAPEFEKNRLSVTEYGRHSDQRETGGPRKSAKVKVEILGDEKRYNRLAHIPKKYDRSPSFPEISPDVRRSRIQISNCTDIGFAYEGRDNDREIYRTGEICDYQGA